MAYVVLHELSKLSLFVQDLVCVALCTALQAMDKTKKETSTVA